MHGPPPGMDTPAQHAYNAFRLPFEFCNCICVELFFRLTAQLDDGMPLEKQKNPVLSELMTEDPTIALCMAVRPFLPSFQRTITEKAKSGRDSCWSEYKEQAALAAKFTLETNWSQVAQAMWRWLQRQGKHLRKTDWRQASIKFIHGVKHLYGLLALRCRSASRAKVDAWLKEVHAEREAAKDLFKAGDMQGAEARYAAILERLLTAESEVQASAEFREEHARILVNAALCQRRLKRFDRAVMSATKALVLEPQNVKALFHRGAAHLGSGDAEKAVEDLARAVALDPATDEARAELRRARATRKMKQGEGKDKHEADLSKLEVLALLAEVARVQEITQSKISALAHKLVEDRAGSGEQLSLIEAHVQILHLGLPDDPTRDYGLDLESFQQLLLGYEDDEEVMMAARKALHPEGKGDAVRASQITFDKIIEIHQVMVKEMQKVLDQIEKLGDDTRSFICGKALENTAELLVSLGVEQQLAVQSEDVEQAVMMYEIRLREDPEFNRCSEELARMMGLLHGNA
eukprot:TRINITY_DN29256_c0_g2_i1.p1 TRINITY_DN29256_c0_g2~~TRINITY_DN29256_c0_g2_i1.p1  ORF type:complete len:520 (-),score=147.46 TRINITY_DN29256_c0_g2_i1:16-1575(-)